MDGIVKGIGAGPRAVTLGVLGLAVVLLSVAGCSSQSGSEQSSQAASLFGTVEASGTAGIRSVFTICGDPQLETVWTTTNGSADIGTLAVSNDEDYLYLEYSMNAGWVMTKWGRVHVGVDSSDYPVKGDGNPDLSLFSYRLDSGGPYTEYTLEIPFTDLGLEHGDCGMAFYIFAYSWAKPNGGRARKAWASTDMNETESPETMYYIEYQIQCCEGWIGGEFRTQSQGGWGTVCHGQNPGCYRDGDGETHGFDVAFPGGLVIGCETGYTMAFTSSAAVQEFIPTGGKPGPLQNDYVDPTDKTEAGVLASQTLALALTLGFDASDPDFGSSEILLADLVLCNTDTDFDGWTVGALFDEANIVLGGCESECAPGEIADALVMVNENYVDGKVDLGFLCTP
jgi:hypothetical protein